jgi:hypothetical protein
MIRVVANTSLLHFNYYPVRYPAAAISVSARLVSLPRFAPVFHLISGDELGPVSLLITSRKILSSAPLPSALPHAWPDAVSVVFFDAVHSNNPFLDIGSDLRLFLWAIAQQSEAQLYPVH